MWLGETGMQCKFLIHDRDASFSALDDVLEAEGIEITKTPFQTPVCNAYAERFVREARETLDTIIVFGDPRLLKIRKLWYSFKGVST
jgi:hypothetical protein